MLPYPADAPNKNTVKAGVSIDDAAETQKKAGCRLSILVGNSLRFVTITDKTLFLGTQFASAWVNLQFTEQ
jgi:hypothetical protein